MKRTLLLPLIIGLLCASCKKEDVIAPAPNPVVGTPVIDTPVKVVQQTNTPAFAYDSLSKTLFLYNQGANPDYTQHWVQGCPTIGFDGKYYYSAWYTGKKGEEPGNYVTVAISQDGITWQEHKLIIKAEAADGRRVDPMFWVSPSGTLNLSWQATNGMWDGAALGSWNTQIKVEGGNVRITQPSLIFHGALVVKPTTLADNSGMLFPISGFNVPKVWNGYATIPTLPEYAGLNIYKTTYNKYSKTLSPLIKFSSVNISGLNRAHDEAMIVELTHENYQLINRTEVGMYTASSTNSGVSWTIPKPLTMLVPNTNSRCYYGRLRSGSLLFILNNSNSRKNLTAYLSKDNAKTWPYTLMIDKRDNASYPDVIQNNNGEICVVYDRNRYTDQEILFARFSEQDIVDNDESHITKTIISHK